MLAVMHWERILSKREVLELPKHVAGIVAALASHNAGSPCDKVCVQGGPERKESRFSDSGASTHTSTGVTKEPDKPRMCRHRSNLEGWRAKPRAPAYRHRHKAIFTQHNNGGCVLIVRADCRSADSECFRSCA